MRSETRRCFFRYFKCWAMFPAAAALTVCGSPVIAQGGPINECFGKSLDYAVTSQNLDNVLLLRSQVFPVAGYASVQGLSDERIPDRVVRQMIAQLTLIYQSCVTKAMQITLRRWTIYTNHIWQQEFLCCRDWPTGLLLTPIMRNNSMCSEGSWKRDYSFGRWIRDGEC